MRALIESSMQDRARICKYRHIYKRKGSPERRTNAVLRGNQSGEIPSTSDRKMSNELQVQHLPRMSDTRRGRHSTAALRSPSLCWCIYRLIIELGTLPITRYWSTKANYQRLEGMYMALLRLHLSTDSISVVDLLTISATRLYCTVRSNSRLNCYY